MDLWNDTTHEPEDEDEDGHELVNSVHVSCPYCGREVEHLVDPAGGAHQVYVEDCEVCCQPWQVTLRVEGGVAWAEVSALDE